MYIVSDLSSADIKNVVLTSKRLYEIGCTSQNYKIAMNNYLLSEADHKEALTITKRRFREVFIQKVNYLNDHLKYLESLFDCRGFDVTVLELKEVGIKNLYLEHLLRKLPNLTKLIFYQVDHVKEKNSEFSLNADPIPLHSLLYLQVSYCSPKIEKIINNLSECSIHEAKLDAINTQTLSNFLMKHETTIKILSVSSQLSSISNVLSTLNAIKLTSLEFSSCRQIMEDKFNSFLEKQDSLESLTISGVYLNDSIWEKICSLKNLRVLNCESGDVSDDRNLITNLSHLTEFSFPYSQRDVIQAFYFFKHENLKILRASFISTTFESFLLLSSNLPNLRTLHAHIRTETMVPAILKNFKNLEHLVIDMEPYFSRLPGCVFHSDGQTLLNLKTLHIKNSFEIDTKTAKKIVVNFTNLEELIFDFTQQFNDECVKILVRGLKKLRVFKLQNCSKRLTKNSLKYLKEYGKNLKNVLIEANFDDECVREILKDRKGMKFAGYDFRIVI